MAAKEIRSGRADMAGADCAGTSETGRRGEAIETEKLAARIEEHIAEMRRAGKTPRKSEIQWMRSWPSLVEAGELHPWYGPCDGLGVDGGCSECAEIKGVAAPPAVPAPQWALEFLLTKCGLKPEGDAEADWQRLVAHLVNALDHLDHIAALPAPHLDVQALIAQHRQLVNRIANGHKQSIGSIDNVRMVQFGVDEIARYEQELNRLEAALPASSDGTA